MLIIAAMKAGGVADVPEAVATLLGAHLFNQLHSAYKRLSKGSDSVSFEGLGFRSIAT
jgi:hypothetical protein